MLRICGVHSAMLHSRNQDSERGGREAFFSPPSSDSAQKGARGRPAALLKTNSQQHPTSVSQRRLLSRGPLGPLLLSERSPSLTRSSTRHNQSLFALQLAYRLDQICANLFIPSTTIRVSIRFHSPFLSRSLPPPCPSAPRYHKLTKIYFITTRLKV
jgi:hypothetical protein